MLTGNIDCHMHIFNEYDDEIFGVNRYDSLSIYDEYFKEQNIDTAFIVYTDENRLNDLKSLCPNVKIRGFYWIRDIENYKITVDADAIKFESFIDDIDILDICDILDSDDRNLPVYIHCGELKSGLSNPKKVEELARLYPERKFIIGHSGAYGPPISKTDMIKGRIESLVTDAVNVAANNDNVYLETSILNYEPKRDAFVATLKNLPRELAKYLVCKILPGTDFPLTIGDVIENDEDVLIETRKIQPNIMGQMDYLSDIFSKAQVPVDMKLHYRNIANLFNV